KKEEKIVMSNQRNFLLAQERLRNNRRKLESFDNQCGCHKDHCSKNNCHHCDSKPIDKKWNALDPAMEHPMSCSKSDVDTSPSSQVKNMQSSDECVVIK